MTMLPKALALLFAIILGLGETYILLTTEKFWPLSIDDYFVVALLLFGALNIERLRGIVILICAWAFAIGNLYAMLFTRLIPETGTGERIGILIVMIFFAAAGLFSTIRALLTRP